MANTRFKTHHGLNATANSYIDGSLEVTGDLIILGNTVSSGSSTGDFISDADQRTLGSTSLRWNLIGFNANLAGTLTANGPTSFSNTLIVTGATTLQNTLTVGGLVNATANLVVGGAAAVTGNVSVTGVLSSVGNTILTNSILTISTNSTNANTLNIGSANVSIDSGVLFVDATNNRIGINNTAPGVALRVTGATDISSTANIQSNANVGGTLGVTGITTLAANAVLNGTLQTISGNSNFDSGVLFVDSVSNRVGINSTTPGVSLDVVGVANVSTSINSALLTVGTNFIANTTGVYHTGLVNAALFTTSGIRANTTALAPTSNTILLGNTIGRWVVSANSITTAGLLANQSGVFPSTNSVGSALGNTSARWILTANTGDFSTSISSGTINATSNGFLANSSTISVGNTSVNVFITTDGITTSGAAGVNPSSNTFGVILGTTTRRWNLTANAGSFSGDVSVSGNLTVSGITTYINTTNLNIGDNIVTLNADIPSITSPTENAGLEINRGSSANVTFLWNETSDSWTLGNTNITGYANASVSVNSALLTVGTNFIANTIGTYHTGVMNAASHTIGSNFVANTLGLYHTGLVNAASHTVGSNFVANSLGVYHTGVVNAASHTTSGIVANTSGVYPVSNTSGSALGATGNRWILNANTGSFSGAVSVSGDLGVTGNTTITTLIANGSTGTAGQVLVSGAGTNVYWGSAGITVSNDTSTDSPRFILFNESATGSLSNVGVSSTKLTFNPLSGILSAVEFSATSDGRLKSDVSTISNALELVSSLRGVNYTFTESGKKNIGVIAQEVEMVIPEVVNEDQNGYKSVNYGNIVGLLIEAIKELKQEIKELKNGNQS